MDESLERISKLVSYWLRHKPQEANLEPDEFGWVELNALLLGLRFRDISLTSEELAALSKSFNKVRWEVDVEGNKIRATHGHSFPILLKEKTKVPPQVLYHGTNASSVTKIISEGLLPMKRHFVHLSENIGMATDVGKRHGKPIIIEINTEELNKDGWVFYQTSDNVWLTTKIPSRYLSFEPWYFLTDKDEYFISELKREIGNRKSHFIYAELNDLELVCKSAMRDDILFANTKTGRHYVVHLTYTKMEQEIEGWPAIYQYSSFDEWVEKWLWSDQLDYYNP